MDSVTQLNNLGSETQSPSVLSNSQTRTAVLRRGLCFCPDSQQWPQLPSLHPAINAPRRHDLFVSSGLAPKKPDPLPTRVASPEAPTRRVLTDTGARRRSGSSEAALLFWPTRKCPRQATPPARHGQQQQWSQLSSPGREGADGSSRKWPSCERRKAEKIGSKRCQWSTHR